MEQGNGVAVGGSGGTREVFALTDEQIVGLSDELSEEPPGSVRSSGQADQLTVGQPVAHPFRGEAFLIGWQ
jgi:hypothetical protein